MKCLSGHEVVITEKAFLSDDNNPDGNMFVECSQCPKGWGILDKDTFLDKEEAPKKVSSKFQDELRQAIDDYITHKLFDKEDVLGVRCKPKYQKLQQLINRCVDNEGERMIYKHQCSHCQRFSPLPFMVHIESYQLWKKRKT